MLIFEPQCIPYFLSRERGLSPVTLRHHLRVMCDCIQINRAVRLMWQLLIKNQNIHEWFVFMKLSGIIIYSPPLVFVPLRVKWLAVEEKTGGFFFFLENVIAWSKFPFLPQETCFNNLRMCCKTFIRALPGFNLVIDRKLFNSRMEGLARGISSSCQLNESYLRPFKQN